MPTRTATALALTLAATLCGACGDAVTTNDPRDAQIAQLTRAVDDLTAANEALGEEVKRQGRQLASLGRVRAPRSELRNRPALEEDDAGGMEEVDHPAPAIAADDELVTEEAVAALLETEPGRKAIAAATSAEIARREQKERRLYVSYQVGVFAREAGLDERQTEQLQSIWKKSMDGGVELRKEFAAIGKLPESQREEARAKAMESMRSLGRERRESVREIMSGEQLEKYEVAEEEIVAGLHGGPRR